MPITTVSESYLIPRRQVLSGAGAASLALAAASCPCHGLEAMPSASSGAPAGVAPQQMVDALYAAFGDNHSRAVHAKGIMLEGRFKSSSVSQSLTKAELFKILDMPVLARFSNFTGIPTIPDTIGDANPRGFAVKLMPPDLAELDVVSHSFDGFPTKTAAEFRELLLAIAASGPGANKPTTLDRYLAAHPIAKTFLTSQKPPPVSYATLSYFGVNSFKFVDAAGHGTFVRYRFVPRAGEQFLDAASLAHKGQDYLQQEIAERVSKNPIQFDWLAQIAEPGDVVEDPSIAWPSTRRTQMLGTVSLTRMVLQNLETDRKALFLPANLPDGVMAADPMLAIRNSAYPLSYRHRQ